MYGSKPPSWGPPPPPPTYGPSPYGQAPSPFGSAPPPPYGYQQPIMPPAPPNPAATRGGWAMGFGLAGFFTCMAPLGIAGAVLGIQSLRMSKSQNTPTSAGAVLGIVMGSLSLLMSVAMGISFWASARQHARELDSANQTLGSAKLDQKTLDQKTACALVEKQLLQGLYENRTATNVKCPALTSAFTADDGHTLTTNSAELQDVTATVGAEQKVFKACFVRASRWMVVSVTEGGEECPDVDLDADDDTDGAGGAAKKKTEAELEAKEVTIRKDVAEKQETIRVEKFEAKLASVKRATEDLDLSELPTSCTAVLASHKFAPGERLEVSAVDFDYLADKQTDSRTQEDWSFMTSDRVRTALDDTRPIKERSNAVRAIASKGGNYVVVFMPDERDWPTVERAKGVFGKKGYAGGTYTGSIVIVEMPESGQARPLCASGFVFETSKTVKAGKNPSDAELLRKVKDDLKNNYEKAAGEKMSGMTDRKLRLGYSILD